MKPFLYLMMTVAACGFVISLLVNLLLMAGVVVDDEALPAFLMGGFFAVWASAGFVTWSISRGTDRLRIWKSIWAACPAWIRWALGAILVYAIINMMAAFAALSSQSGSHPGDFSPVSMRFLTGNLMFFFGAFFAVLHARFHSPHLFYRRKCSNGHSMPPNAQFCPQCGAAAPEGSKGV